MDKYLKKELKIIRDKVKTGDLDGNEFVADIATEEAFTRYRKRRKKAKKGIKQLRQEMADTF